MRGMQRSRMDDDIDPSESRIDHAVVSNITDDVGRRSGGSVQTDNRIIRHQLDIDGAPDSTRRACYENSHPA